MSTLIHVNYTVLSCLILMMAGSIAVAHEANSRCGSDGNVCAAGFRCVSTSQGKFQCVGSQQQKVGQPPQKRSKSGPEDLLKALSGADEAVTVGGPLGGGPMVGPCVGVAPERKPHVDQGVPRVGGQPLTKILRPIMLKNPEGIEVRTIARSFQRKRGHFSRCHQRALAKQRTLSGTIKMLVTVAETGTVSGVRVIQNTAENEVLAQCMTRVVRRMRFPRSKQGPIEFEVPLLFRP